VSHDSTDPAVADWDLAMGSTSAQLRQTQQALAASQADLTRVELELKTAEWQRDGWAHTNKALAADLDAQKLLNAELKDEVTQRLGDQLRAAEREQVLRDELASMARDLTRLSKERDNLRVELTSAYQGLGDVEAERDRLRRDLANSTVARHAAEQQLRRLDPTPTKEGD